MKTSQSLLLFSSASLLALTLSPVTFAADQPSDPPAKNPLVQPPPMPPFPDGSAGSGGRGFPSPEGRPQPPGGPQFGHSPFPGMPPLPPPVLKLTSYLGLVSRNAPSELSAQLGLANGFGLLVDQVVADGPASTAGIQRFDVLTKLDDQQLVEPGQLSTLVRAQKKDATVTLTLLRKGQEQKVTVKVGERMLPEHRPMPPMPPMPPFPLNPMMPGGPGHHEGPGEPGKSQIPFPPIPPEAFPSPGQGGASFSPRERERSEEINHSKSHAEVKIEDLAGQDQKALTLPISPEELFRQIQSGTTPTLQLPHDGSHVIYNLAQGKTMLSDLDGTVILQHVDGQRKVFAADPQGNATFSAAIDTDEQLTQLPAPLRAKVESMLQMEIAKPESHSPSTPSGETGGIVSTGNWPAEITQTAEFSSAFLGETEFQ